MQTCAFVLSISGGNNTATNTANGGSGGAGEDEVNGMVDGLVHDLKAVDDYITLLETQLGIQNLT
jgi:hypothetical protein